MIPTYLLLEVGIFLRSHIKKDISIFLFNNHHSVSSLKNNAVHYYY